MRRLVLLLLLFGSACAPFSARPSAVKAAKSERDTLYEQGLTLLERGDLTRAEQYLASAHRAARDRESLVALLTTCVRAGRLRSALAHAAPYRAAHPRDVRLLQVTAAIHLALGELTSARELLERALCIEGALAEAHYLLARVHLKGAKLAVISTRLREHRRALRHHFARYLALAPSGPHAAEAHAELVSSARRRLTY